MSTTPSTPSTPSTPATPDTPDRPTTSDVGDTTRPESTATTREPQYLKGPAPFAIVLGLLGLVVAGATLVAELTDLTVPWNDLGPWSVVAAGIVVLLVGAIGLRASRAQD